MAGAYLSLEFAPHTLFFVRTNKHVKFVQVLYYERLARPLVQREQYLLYGGVAKERGGETGIDDNIQPYHVIRTPGTMSK